MTFEEFFKKKRIDLTALQACEPLLFAEFKTHFEQMGEKSFDHTKKYWFNKLRLLYHLAPEQKPEKMHLENRLAEQTIVETLTESIPVPSSKVGFKPRFNSGVANAENGIPEALIPDVLPDTLPEIPVPKPAFKPRFNPKMIDAKPAEDAEIEKPIAEGQHPQAEIAAEAVAPKPAFKPRFNMKMAAPKPAEEAESIAPKTESIDETAESPVETTAPKPGFKPRFNMKTVAPKSPEEETTQPEMLEPVSETAAAPVTTNPAATEIPGQETASKPAGFKPRFNAARMKPKPPQE